ncbi:MAG: phosphodiesterase [Lachnospiraceae bacterium]|nr:phosphodiesterase [Lachnospiraceae bacterium]
MKFMIASDIHGSSWYCKKMLEAYEREEAQRLLLLGDILYHGPRNDLPREYHPKQVIAMLNPMKDDICAVRGNCEAEVDQMVLDFPVLADYGFFLCGSHTVYMTHGHHYHPGNLPPMKAGDVLLYGHTHVLKAEKMGEFYQVNPGSVSIPKEGNPPSYAVLENETFTIKTLEGEVLRTLKLD